MIDDAARRAQQHHQQAVQQMAQQQKQGWDRMQEQWDRQAAARASGAELGPMTTGDRVSLVVGTLVLLVLVVGSIFAWTQLRDGDGASQPTSRSGSSQDRGGPGAFGTDAVDEGFRERAPSGTAEDTNGAGAALAVPEIGKEDTLGEVAELLRDSDLKSAAYYDDLDGLCSDATSAIVTRLDPEPGTTVNPGTIVKVFVSRLDSEGMVTVPDLSGFDEQSVRDKLAPDLRLGSELAAGQQVKGQSPTECAKVPRDSSVTVYPATSSETVLSVSPEPSS